MSGITIVIYSYLRDFTVCQIRYLFSRTLSAPALTSLLILSFSFLRSMICFWQVEGRTCGTATCSCFLMILPLTLDREKHAELGADQTQSKSRSITLTVSHAVILNSRLN